jgi:lipoate-protein ligase B
MFAKRCYVAYIGNVPYKEAMLLQDALVERRITNIGENRFSPNLLLLLQHPPVYTVGRRGLNLSKTGNEGELIGKLSSLGADYVQVGSVVYVPTKLESFV